MTRRWIAIAVVAVLALVAAPACSRGGGDDDGFRLDLSGRAEVAGEAERALEPGSHAVAAGDTVRMLEGDAVLELPGDRSLLLRAGGDDASVVTVGERPAVVEGDAVVLAGDDVRFEVGDVDVRLPSGAARVERGLSVTVAVYAGTAEVRSAGRAFGDGLRALRQLSIPATGVLPRTEVPLVYEPADPWDLRFLGDAIDLGARLEDRSRGLTGQLGPGVEGDAELLRELLPDLAGDPALDSLLDGVERTPGESVVGAAIVVESGAPVGERWDDVFDFRDAGAGWGLVALDQQVERDPLLDRINGAVGRSPLLFAAAPTTSTTSGPSPTSPPPTSPPTTEPPDGGGGGGEEPPPTTPPTAPPPTAPPITVPVLPDPDEDDAVDDEDAGGGILDAVVGDVIDGLLRDDESP